MAVNTKIYRNAQWIGGMRRYKELCTYPERTNTTPTLYTYAYRIYCVYTGRCFILIHSFIHSFILIHAIGKSGGSVQVSCALAIVTSWAAGQCSILPWRVARNELGRYSCENRNMVVPTAFKVVVEYMSVGHERFSAKNFLQGSGKMT